MESFLRPGLWAVKYEKADTECVWPWAAKCES